MADERIPPGDLLLVSVSVAFSLLLATSVALRERLRLSPAVELAATTIAVIGCLACGFAALGLAFAGRITLDAMSAAFIGLLPAVQAGPLLDFRLPAARVRMRRRPELRGAGGPLRYIRLGSVAVDDSGDVYMISRLPQGPREGSSSASVAPAAPWTLLFILRHVGAQRPRVKDISLASSHGGWRYPRRFFFGQVVRPGEAGVNVVHLLDDSAAGDPFQWWGRLCDAAHVVARPERVQLTSADAAVAGLAAAADLVVAGDLALYFFSAELQRMVLVENFQMALRGTPASVTNALLDAVGLATTWGPINVAAVRAFATDFGSCCRAHRYGVLFFLLVVVSNLFSIDASGVTGNVLAERLTAAVKEDEMRDLTRCWLAGWGLAVGDSSAGVAGQAAVVGVTLGSQRPNSGG